jgi:two-component system OmpR family response regulator
VSLIDELRKRGVWTLVLVVRARGSVDDRVRGLQAGGDDYLTKPFAFAELVARVQALVRRASRAPEPTTLTVDDLILDLLSRRVRRGDQIIDLRPREFSLLEYLMRNAGKVISKTMILSHVWDYSFDPQTNIVDVLVSRLREKIDRRFEKKLLHTVRGVRYLMRASPRKKASSSTASARRGACDASSSSVAGHRAADLLRHAVPCAARSADHRQQARHIRGGVCQRRPEGLTEVGSR